MKKKMRSSRSRAINRALVSRVPGIRGTGDKTARLNAVLVDLTRKTEKQLEYWRVFQQFLADEREKRIERIEAAIRSCAISGYSDESLVRIVDSRYQTRPLSSYGSVVVPPGGRFNFGEITSHFAKFQGLYLASDFRTAAAERFLRDQTESHSIDQASLDFRLDPRASFSSYRISATGLTVIDITNTESLRPFVEVIAEIDPPAWLHDLAKRLKQPVPQTVKTVEGLESLLLDPNFTQWGSLIDQPSASQWFGYYVKKSGINGIRYPSVRKSGGYNVVVFPDTFGDTNARVALVDPADGVRPEDRVLDGKTAAFLMQASRSDDGSVH